MKETIIKIIENMDAEKIAGTLNSEESPEALYANLCIRMIADNDYTLTRLIKMLTISNYLNGYFDQERFDLCKKEYSDFEEKEKKYLYKTEKNSRYFCERRSFLRTEIDKFLKTKYGSKLESLKRIPNLDTMSCIIDRTIIECFRMKWHDTNNDIDRVAYQMEILSVLDVFYNSIEVSSVKFGYDYFAEARTFL